jgi:uncharacterized protein YndB with AHSA1/START domain
VPRAPTVVALDLDIEAPPERVWAQLAEPERAMRWLENVRDLRYSDGEPPRPGSRVTLAIVERRRPPRPHQGELVAFEPGRRLAFWFHDVPKHVFRLELDYRLEAQSSGTRLGYRCAVTARSRLLSMFLRLVAGLAKGMAKKQLGRLKQAAERG